MTALASKGHTVCTKFWLAILKGRSLGRPRHRWENIKVAHKEFVGVNCMYALVNSVMSPLGSIKAFGGTVCFKI
jgi:hypothetical protein